MPRNSVRRTRGRGWRPEPPAVRRVSRELDVWRPARILVCLEASDIRLMGAVKGLPGQFQTRRRKPASRR